MTPQYSNQKFLRISGLDGQDVYLPNPKKMLKFLYNHNYLVSLRTGQVRDEPFKFSSDKVAQLEFSPTNKLFFFYSQKEYQDAVNFYCALFNGVDQEILESSFGTKKAKRYTTLFDSSLKRIPDNYLDEIALLIWHFTISVSRDAYTSFHKIYTTSENETSRTEINEENFRFYLQSLKAYFIQC